MNRCEDFRVATTIPARKGRAEIANHFPDLEKQEVEAAKKGPDFAASFVVEEWSCGSFCTYFVIVKVGTFEIYRSPFNVNYMCPEYGGGSALDYRLDSQLFIVNGAIETVDPKSGFVVGPCGKFFYKWDGHSLKLIDSVIPVAAPPSKSPNVPH
jgi:hypothetical protein